MRLLTALIVALVLPGCRQAPHLNGQSSAVASVTERVSARPQLDSLVEFLLAAAAADFHAHPSPAPARFRGVRVGHLSGAGGAPRYMLCGEFLAAPVGGRPDWTPFATIKTSGYEQYLGAQAAAFCQGSPVVWDTVGELSSALWTRLASLR